LQHARDLLDAFRDDYNQSRPHSSLGDLTPAEFAAQAARAPMGAPLDPTNPPHAVVTTNPKPTNTTPGLSF
ncbi:MAG: transposase, partial [Opitutaceae bacterium]|nr:transposase [Opitutaceae bacterium]